MLSIKRAAVAAALALLIWPIGSAPAAHSREASAAPPASPSQPMPPASLVQMAAGGAAPSTMLPEGLATAAAMAPQSSTCTWQVDTDGLLPDSNATYELLVLLATSALSLTVAGTFPAARYVALSAYTAQSVPLASLTDDAFPPDPGSTNPFAVGGPRGVGTFTDYVVFGPAPNPPLPGTMYVNVPFGTEVVMLYRIYLPDTGASITGNVPPPLVTARSVVTGQPVTCPQVPVTFPTPSPTATPNPATPTPTVPVTSPAPILVRQTLALAYPNEDAAYLATNMQPSQNPVIYVLRFHPPTTPRTLAGEPFDPSTQLRYWSICAYTMIQAPLNCGADETFPLNRKGYVTVVFGPAGARPANATRANGVVWAPLGTFSKTVLLVLRHLLPAPTFTQSIFAVPLYQRPGPWMGSYTPTLTQCSTAQFEANGCVSE